jgi:predicted nucleotidyltransferase component of viral defense system
MPVAENYRRQVALLIKVMPFVAAEKCFALKGGTAINLFVRNMPRLSVDLDLTYLPIEDRDKSLTEIHAAMRRIGDAIVRGIPGAVVEQGAPKGETRITKLIVRADEVQIKIEVTPVLRGCVYDPEMRSVAARVEEQFGFAEMQVVSFPDLYAGKIVAALDRQHPRDLFDVRDLLANEGISDELRRAFIVYLVSTNRPFAELLEPTRLDIAEEFARGFEGMTNQAVTIDELLNAREQMIAEVVGKMPADHRKFVLGLKRGEPDWKLLKVPGAEGLPAVRWRLQNLAKMDKEKRAALIARLQKILQLEEPS